MSQAPQSEVPSSGAPAAQSPATKTPAANTKPIVDPMMRNLSRQHGFEPLDVEGKLPADLTGTLYRCGPGLFERFNQRLTHLFEADGVVSAFRFDGNGVQGASRVVESAGYREEEAAQKFLYSSMASWGDRMKAAKKQTAKTSGNTSPFAYQGRLYALMEAGLLQEIDADTLETLDDSDLGVVDRAFSAHPHRVAAHNCAYNFGVRYGRQMEIDLYRLPDTDAPTKLTTVVAPWSSMVHDFVATERHLVLIMGPAKLVMWRAISGLGGMSKLFQWDPSLGTSIIVIPLDDPSNHQIIEMDAAWTWHFANGYSDGDRIVIDHSQYPNFDSFLVIGSDTADIAPPKLTRTEIDLTKKTVSQRQLEDRPIEFPHVHPRVEGAAHSVIFGQTIGPKGESIARYDGRNDTFVAWESPDKSVLGEPVLVTRSEREDDVWALAPIYSRQTDRSGIVVLDGANLEAGPVATAWMDHPIPVTFHGTFIPTK